MDPAAPATNRVLLAFLARREASQRQIVRDVGVSLGHVSQIFHWLEENGFAERGRSEKRPARGRGKEVYALNNPTGLLRAISLFRPMVRLRQFTLAVDIPKETLVSDLSPRPIVFCLGTALERYSRFYRADDVSIYAFPGGGALGAESLRRDLSNAREGITRVSSYRLPTKMHGRRARGLPEERVLEILKASGFLAKTQKGFVTTKVQTVVDLFCDGKAFAARDLVKELWGVEL